jgi:hypothetical protein
MAANYSQPDFRNPAANPLVTVRPINLNYLAISAVPAAAYIQPVTAKDDPQGTITAGKSGKGGPG